MGRIRHRLVESLPSLVRLARKSAGRTQPLPVIVAAIIASFVVALSFSLQGQGGQADAAELVSVQSGTTTMSVGAGSPQTVNVAISSVDTASSILFFNMQGSSIQPGDGQIRGQLTSATNIQFFRADDTSQSNFTIQWYVAEFSSGVSVQRGTLSPVNSTSSVTISPVNLSNSFVMISGSVLGTHSTYGSDDFFQAQLTSTTNLQITHNTTSAQTADWQVVEFTGASVQRGTGVLSGTSLSTTVPITAVDLSRSIVLLSWRTDINLTGPNFLRARFTATNEITVHRGLGTSANIDFAYEVIEFSDGTVVQGGNRQFTSADTSLTAGLLTVDTSRTVALLSTAGGRWGGSHAFASNDDTGPGLFTTTITGSSTLSIVRESTGSVAADASWFVIEFNGVFFSLSCKG